MVGWWGVTETDLREAESAVAALAVPRLCGSAGAGEAEAELRRRIDALGYELRELPFEFSAWPGRFGVSLAGALVVLATVGTTVLLLAGRSGAALVWVLAGVAVIGGVGVVGRPAVRWLPWGRTTAANWWVARPGARPRYLVVAHRDSKSQASSLYLRAGAVAAAPISLAGLAVLALAGLVGPGWSWPPPILVLGLLGGAAGMVLILCFAANRSPGALDNASGLAALLTVAGRERERDDVAFLVTDAEELGLAGAMAVCRQLRPVAAILNLDGLDDEGAFHLMDGRGSAPPPATRRVADALLESARALGVQAARRRLPPGVLADHIPFAKAGFAAVTIMRGSSRSLRRVHRPADDAARTRGAGAAVAAALVSGALNVLRGLDMGTDAG